MESKKDYERTFRQYDLREHIYKKPDTYIGSTSKLERHEFVYDLKTETMMKKNVMFPEGVENLFMELLTNASDNVLRSQNEDIPFKNIEVTLSPHYVEVTNNGGLTIPVETIKTDKGFSGYKPELIFGVLLTTTNSDHEKVKVEAGKNGYGGKVTNIFSTKFEIEIGDHINNKKYLQTWTDQMTDKSDPKIRVYRRKTPFIRVRHYLDFERFGYSQYPLEALELFISRIIFVSFSCNCKIVINFKEFDQLEDFQIDNSFENGEKTLRFNELSLPKICDIINPDCEKLFYYKYKVPENDKTHLVSYSSNKKMKRGNLEIELCILDTPDEGVCYSFANGIYTKNGGVHVTEALYSIPKEILNMINEETKRKFNMSVVKPNISIVISCHVDDPGFSNQYKHELNSPQIHIDVDISKIKKMKNWGFAEMIKDRVKSSNLKKLKQTDGKQTKFVNVEKAEDANFAGHRTKSKNCILLIAEGLSAKSFLVKFISNIKNGRDYYGCYPLKGKPINAMKTEDKKLYTNKEIQDLKMLIGLKENTDYTNENNFKNLRYGKVVIVADSDVDGKHIVGLLLTFFHRYRSLLDIGYVHFMKTPILTLTYKGEYLRFYNLAEYEQWTETHNNVKGKPKYYKGLGTTSDKDIKYESKNPKYVKFNPDVSCDESMDLAFGKSNGNLRKIWLSNNSQIDDEYRSFENNIDISDFINTDMCEYSFYNIRRSIPCIMDGLKPSQRKCLWAGILKWKPKIGKKFKEENEFKVSRFSSYVAETTSYLHGEDSLNNTIISMAQNIVGTNNMNIFYPSGQFGTRNGFSTKGLGSDAAKPRYIFTYPEWWWPYIYKPEDNDILELLEEEGEPCEPLTLCPVIPMCLVNGANGIGTGWKSEIPCYHPIDLCIWLKQRLKNKKLPKVIPHYLKFKGTYEIKGFVDDKNYQDMTLEEILNHNPKLVKSSLVTKGIYVVEDENVIRIIELPISVTTNSYLEKLKKLKSENIISDFNNYSTDEDVEFTIKNFTKPINHKNLMLSKTLSLNNMNVIIDHDATPTTIYSTEMYLELFYKLRLPLYQLRKDKMIEILDNDLEIINQKWKFINSVLEEELIIMKRPIDEVENDMRDMNIDVNLLKTTNLKSFTKEKLNKLQEKINEIKIKTKNIRSKTLETLWYNDLYQFQEEYKKVLGNELDKLMKEMNSFKNKKKKKIDQDEIEMLQKQVDVIDIQIQYIELKEQY